MLPSRGHVESTTTRQDRWRLRNARMSRPAKTKETGEEGHVQTVPDTPAAILPPLKEDWKRAFSQWKAQQRPEASLLTHTSTVSGADTSDCLSVSAAGEPGSTEYAVTYVEDDGSEITFKLEDGHINFYVNAELEVLHVIHLFQDGCELEVHHMKSIVPNGDVATANRVMELFTLRRHSTTLEWRKRVGFEADAPGGVIERLCGQNDKNFKHINLESGGAAVHLRGCGIGRAEGTEPLTIVVRSTNETSLGAAKQMVIDLVRDVCQDCRKLRCEKKQDTVVMKEFARSRCSEPLNVTGGSSSGSVSTRRTMAEPESTSAELAPRPELIDENRYRGSVKYFRGSWGFVICKGITGWYENEDVFVSKIDCDIVPKQHDILSFNLALGNNGKPKAVYVINETHRQSSTAPVLTDARDWFASRQSKSSKVLARK